jgi:Pentapeptide repeats (8 copies)
MDRATSRRKRMFKGKRALFFIVHVAVGSALALFETAHAYTRDQLKCPVRSGWTEDSDECPCQNNWKPILEQFEKIRTGETIILCNANLRRAHLNRVPLEGADLRGADLSDADLSRKRLWGTKLQGANLESANLTEASLVDTYIDGAHLAFSNLSFATYATIGIPNKHVAGITGLSTILLPITAKTRRSYVAGSVQLRKLLEEAGYREDERELTFAIEHWKTRDALSLWRHDFMAAIEASLRKVLFEWTTKYGLRPFRAIEILLVLIIAFAFGAYTPALIKGGRIYRIWPGGRLETDTAGGSLADKAEVESLCPKNVFEAASYALQFSTLSAFNIGWREFNVGNWIGRLYRREHTLIAVGWVRTVAGIQALTSVYLLAIWALTYFGRPFQ